MTYITPYRLDFFGVSWYNAP